MKKTYISPQCEVCQMDGACDLLMSSDPAYGMADPGTGINQGGGSSIWDDPATDDDNWGY